VVKTDERGDFTCLDNQITVCSGPLEGVQPGYESNIVGREAKSAALREQLRDKGRKNKRGKKENKKKKKKNKIKKKKKKKV